MFRLILNLNSLSFLFLLSLLPVLYLGGDFFEGGRVGGGLWGYFGQIISI